MSEGGCDTAGARAGRDAGHEGRVGPKIFEDPRDMRRWSRQVKREGGGSGSAWNTVAFVPTMGSLHAGHLSLVAEAKKRATHVVVSIYVNPSQFAPHEDFSEYPRHFDSDLRKLAPYQVDAIFVPKNLYARRGEAPAAALAATGPREDGGGGCGEGEGGAMAAAARKDPLVSCSTGSHQTWVRCVDLERPLCGQSRPHFFKGVATVVTKLFHIVEPDVAVFGRKDFQQLRVIETMVAELDFSIDVVGVPIAREEDGLAMSSRNALLSPGDRARATCIHGALCDLRDQVLLKAKAAAAEVGEGERGALDAGEAKRVIAGKIAAGGGRVDYVSVIDPTDLSDIEGDLVAFRRRQCRGAEAAGLEIQGSGSGSGSRPGAVLVAVAAFFNSVRLIDNLLIEP